MISKRLQSWLRQMFNRAHKKCNTERRSFRPRLEHLEDRNLLNGYLVTSTANSGAGTLHQAILDANANPGPDTIDFDIGAGGNQTISLSSPLPTLVNTVTIDGTSQPGWFSVPLITVDGTSVGFQGNGLTVTADGCKIKGLVVQHFANDDGVGLYSNNNVLTGNTIEHNGVGVEIANGVSGNVIGGTTVRGRNIIASNSQDGVLIAEDSTNNVVQGNFIGTDGTSALANGVGVFIEGGADNNTVGGTAAGAGNYISGNTQFGIWILTSGNQVQGNNIGINAINGGALANGSYGVILQGSNNTVGGAAAGAGNTISGNQGFGIRIDSSGNQVLGNSIGTASIGGSVFAVPNGSGGVLINGGSNNTVGGTAAGAGNLISGNTGPGIKIEVGGNGNLVLGNKIGTNAAGTTTLANSGSGIDIRGSNNTVGGTAAGAGNLISGNHLDGILIESTGSGNLLLGNKVGTNVTGTAGLANMSFGVEIAGLNNTVGGTAAGAGNVISDSNGAGLLIDAFTGNQTEGNLIQGNKIGTNAAGTAALPNSFGIEIAGVGNTVGGTTAGSGNLISGNSNDGISIESSGANNQILGNKIGTNITGTTALPNSFEGVIITGNNNTVGGTAVGAGNIIAFNGFDGVSVQSGTGNAIRRNSIFANGQRGITLFSGAGNNNQAAPTLTSATFVAATRVMTLHGTLTSKPSTSFTLEFFANAVPVAPLVAQGTVYLGSFVVTTLATGSVTFTATITIPTTTPYSSVTTPIITATATDPTGDTSQFSNGVHDPVAPAKKPAPKPAPKVQPPVAPAHGRGH